MRARFARRTLGAIVAVASLLCLVEPATAGTTGAITGTVVDATTKAPIAGTQVTATSPSQIAKVTTDASGRFIVHLARRPIHIPISAEHAGYDLVSVTGVSVFADQSVSCRSRCRRASNRSPASRRVRR